jgi:poly(A) polymerase
MALLSDDTAVAKAAIERLKLSNSIVSRINAARDGFRLDGPAIECQLYRKGATAVLDSAMLQQAGGQADDKVQVAVDAAKSWKSPVFPIKGQDILDLGILPGPDVGATLGEIEDWWIERKFEPGRDACLKMARRLIS